MIYRGLTGGTNASRQMTDNTIKPDTLFKLMLSSSYITEATRPPGPGRAGKLLKRLIIGRPATRSRIV